MSTGASTGLARVTIAAPRRRVDVALPEQVPAAELMPVLLRHAGDGLADDGQAHGGWVLRRSDGSVIDQGRSLSSQEVRDGEILHLVARQAEWPEMDYDDVVDAIATGARRQSRSWGAAATRRAGLSIAAVALLLALVLILASGPPWLEPGLVALGLAVLLLVLGASLARALSDSGAGAVIASVAMAFGFFGGLAVFQGDQPLTDAQAPQYLAASAALFVVGLLGYLGIGDRTQFFVGGMTAGALGMVAGLISLADNVDPIDAAAILVALVVAVTPTMPLLSIRLGKLPMPRLPTDAEELVADPPPVPLPRVQATVRRTDELLTGMLGGGALVLSVAQIVLVGSDRGSAVVLVILAAVATLLRGRLFPAVRHRAPLLVAGVIGAGALVAGWLSVGDLRMSVAVPGLIVLACVALAAGIRFQSRPPGPYLGRIADILDVVTVLAVIPVMCWVVGLFGYLRGLYG